MRELIREAAFFEISEYLERTARLVLDSSSRILLSSSPTLEGSLSVAPLEGALIDSGIPYRRRFTNEIPNSGTFVRVSDTLLSNYEQPSVSFGGTTLSPIVVEGLKGHQGDSRKGPLSPVAQSHAIAQIICPSSKRLRIMRPWALSGNWINRALDTSYDPVLSSIRDFLVSEGSIRVVPVTEVPDPEPKNYPWLDMDVLLIARESWPEMGLDERSEVMSALALPSLLPNIPSTPRLEGLLWQCILGIGWDSDLASQISRAQIYWDELDPRDASNLVTDSILSTGRITSLKS